ncbi:diacylglycerol/lipid kinase family protein [Psychrosphaera aestuarii]|uniref:diacylglycerol/lipid kinase family protein n=1 Tax=Psychrosphaera aestuarii TaxID=1266052 RepID=UPI001B3386CC|nr:diacylglycerol kinase family protein [Psychrosphaera aestuarii]
MNLSKKSGSKDKTPYFLIVFNPVQNTKRQQLLAQLITALKVKKLQYSLYPTEANLTANQHYFKHHLNEFSDIIVLGGDGTFNVVINCVLQDGLNTNIAIGLLPAGTGNDFAKRWYDATQYPKGLSNPQLIDIVIADKTKTLYIGECAFNGNTRYFHNVLGVGFDAVIAKQLVHKKSMFKSLSYLVAAARYIPFYREPESELLLSSNESSSSNNYINVNTYRYKNLITAFANSKFFGGGLPIAPSANPMDANLHLIRVPKLALHRKLALLTKLTMGKHLAEKEVHHEILTSDHQGEIIKDGLEIEADGEFIGETPCLVKLSSHTLKIKA